ncbi:unnamed protein product [Brassica oleracea var. botrytis]
MVHIYQPTRGDSGMGPVPCIQDRRRRKRCVYGRFGGVCIFLSKAESFCLPAACLHDQRPNCIYHLSKNSFGIRCMDDDEKETTGDLNFPGPFWFPPKLDSKANVVNILVLTFRRSNV